MKLRLINRWKKNSLLAKPQTTIRHTKLRSNIMLRCKEKRFTLNMLIPSLSTTSKSLVDLFWHLAPEERRQNARSSRAWRWVNIKNLLSSSFIISVLIRPSKRIFLSVRKDLGSTSKCWKLWFLICSKKSTWRCNRSKTREKMSTAYSQKLEKRRLRRWTRWLKFRQDFASMPRRCSRQTLKSWKIHS